MVKKAAKIKGRFGGNIKESIGGKGKAATPADDKADLRRRRRYVGVTSTSGGITSGFLAIDLIRPDPRQPRKEFDPVELEQLAETIRVKGVLQPIRVWWNVTIEEWIVIAGERRLRAAKLAGLGKVPCVFVDRAMTRVEILEEQLIENGQRQDFKPLEQARGYAELIEGGYTAAAIAEKLGVHRAQVSRSLQLLELPTSVQKQVETGKLAPAAAVELRKLDGDAAKEEVAGQAVNGKLSRGQLQASVQILTTCAKCGPAKGLLLQCNYVINGGKCCRKKFCGKCMELHYCADYLDKPKPSLAAAGAALKGKVLVEVDDDGAAPGTCRRAVFAVKGASVEIEFTKPSTMKDISAALRAALEQAVPTAQY